MPHFNGKLKVKKPKAKKPRLGERSKQVAKQPNNVVPAIAKPSRGKMTVDVRKTLINPLQMNPYQFRLK